MLGIVLTASGTVLLVAVTIVCLVMAAELRRAQRRVERSGIAVGDGPALGHVLPRRTRTLLGKGASEGRVIMLALAGDCQPCRDVLAEAADETLASHLAVVCTGNPSGLDGHESILERALREPGASVVFAECGITFTPFAAVLDDGIVIAKGYLSPGELTRVDLWVQRHGTKQQDQPLPALASGEARA